MFLYLQMTPPKTNQDFENDPPAKWPPPPPSQVKNDQSAIKMLPEMR